MTAELDELAVVLDDGTAFPYVTNCTITDDFLSPCQTADFTIAADETRFELLGRIRPGVAYTITVNGAPQITGLVDRAAIRTSHAGTEIHIQGRDLLQRIVDGNVDPTLQIAKTLDFQSFAQKVFEMFGVINVQILDTGDGARNVAVGKAVKAGKSKRKRKISDQCNDLRPKEGEGGYTFFSRIAKRLGFQAWAMPDGKGVVIASPDYEQEPSYDFTLHRIGDPTTNILEASCDNDQTGVPSHVWVRGKTSKAGVKTSFVGFALNPDATVFKPFYCVDDQSSEKAHCDAFARLVLSRALRHAQKYEITVRGFSDPVTGRIFNVDTIANVDDDVCGIKGRMWVFSRVLSKSRQSGSTTRMTLIPANALLLDYLVGDDVPVAPKDYKTASAAVKPVEINIPISLRGSPDLVLNWVNGAG